jgi:hypothetical protein
MSFAVMAIVLISIVLHAKCNSCVLLLVLIIDSCQLLGAIVVLKEPSADLPRFHHIKSLFFNIFVYWTAAFVYSLVICYHHFLVLFAPSN